MKGTPLWKAIFIEHRLPYRYNEFFKNQYLKILKLFKKDINYIYNEEFATQPWRNKAYKEDFADIILKEFNPKSIIDFGCGTGDLLAPFEKKGINVLGIDGSKHNKEHKLIKNFEIKDLRKKIKTKKYDLCFCLEVAEHIDEKYSNQLIKNLTQSSNTIIFTAAPPGQGGIDHCNEKPHDWWIQRFVKQGFDYDDKLTRRIKELMHKIPTNSKKEKENLNMYINNLLIFKNNGNRI